jgi:hypothetical protein
LLSKNPAAPAWQEKPAVETLPAIHGRYFGSFSQIGAGGINKNH